MTAQIGEILYYEGVKYFMASEPPLNPPAAEKYDIRFLWGCTACWRGYQAEWEISDQKLYIKAIQGRAEVTDKEKYRQEKLRLRKLLRQGEITPQENGKMLREFYKNLTLEKKVDLAFLYGTSEPVFAAWVSGTIRVPRGNLLNYVHAGYASVFEEDLFLGFEKGILVNTRVQKNENPL